MAVKKENYDVIVVGAGLVGAAFALLLAQRSNAKIVVLERAPRLGENTPPNQRVVALGKAATDVLRQVGVFDELDANTCYPYDKMVVWDEHSKGELSFSAVDYQQAVLGHMVDSLGCALLLQRALARHENIDVHYSFSASSIDFGGRSADQLAMINSDQHQLSAQLIVAADGGRSWVRQQAKIFSEQNDYQQRGIVAMIRTQQAHQDTAWQRFLKTGPLAVLPLSDNQSSIVWSADNDYAQQLMDLPDIDFSAAIMKSLQGRLGEVELLSKRAAFPLISQRAERYFKRRLVLIGDAAHSIHPLAGQGANLGFKDAASLAECFCDQEISAYGDLALLQKYQRSRKSDNQQTDLMMSLLHQAYKNNAAWWQNLRGAGMNWISDSESLKQLLVKQAMGI